LPFAHAVGGLVDTIRVGETGVLFERRTPAALVSAAERAAGLLSGAGASERIAGLLALDVSWRAPAAHYESVFAGVAREAARRI
jgi:glycogen synthase